MNAQYQIYHDLGLPIVLIGDTFHNHTLEKLLADTRSVQRVSLEHALHQSDQWYQDHQFMAVVTTASFKQKLKQSLENRPVRWFSVVSKNTLINSGVQVGFNTLINHFNVIYDDAIIGDHVTLTNFCQISHDVKIGDLCHVSPYGYLCFTSLGKGSCVGLRSSFPGKPDALINVAPWTNIHMDSRVTRSIHTSGTYYGNKKINDQCSLDIKLL